MNYMESFTAKIQALLDESSMDVEARHVRNIVMTLSLALGVAVWGMVNNTHGAILAALAYVIVLPVLPAITYFWLTVKSNHRNDMIDEMLPSFLSMMASNIRSGVTYDRALLLSTRKEFGPLAKEIDLAARQTVAGKPLTEAMMDMAKRSRSETFAKTMRLIVEGTNAGGNLAEMLEITAIDIRQSASLKKEITATIMVYRLFIVVSSAIGAPLLYGLTGFLIKIFTGIRSSSASAAVSGPLSSALPMMSNKGEMISGELFFWYSIVAIALTVFLSSLASGMITKGKETEGLSDLSWMLLAAFAIFFGVNFVFGFLLGQLAF